MLNGAGLSDIRGGLGIDKGLSVSHGCMGISDRAGIGGHGVGVGGGGDSVLVVVEMGLGVVMAAVEGEVRVVEDVGVGLGIGLGVRLALGVSLIEVAVVVAGVAVVPVGAVPAAVSVVAGESAVVSAIVVVGVGVAISLGLGKGQSDQSEENLMKKRTVRQTKLLKRDFNNTHQQLHDVVCLVTAEVATRQKLSKEALFGGRLYTPSNPRFYPATRSARGHFFYGYPRSVYCIAVVP